MLPDRRTPECVIMPLAPACAQCGGREYRRSGTLAGANGYRVEIARCANCNYPKQIAPDDWCTRNCPTCTEPNRTPRHDLQWWECWNCGARVEGRG